MENNIKEGLKKLKGRLSHRIDSRKLNPGDHIYVYRGLTTYTHHGIYLGGEYQYVIHFTTTGETSINVKGKSKQPCTKCGYDSSKNRGVVKTCLDCFVREENPLGGRSVHLRDYGVSKLRCHSKRPGTCGTTPASTAAQVLKTAMELHENNNFGEYNLANNNCESFATFCKTGTKFSAQAEKRLQKNLLHMVEKGCRKVVTLFNEPIDQK